MTQLPLPFGASAKRCIVCGELKALAEYHKSRNRPDELQPKCRACNLAMSKKWYRENPDVRGRRMDQYARDRRQSRQVRVLLYLRVHPCVDCGEADPIVLEFDHLRDKIANVSAMANAARPWSTIMAEIEKCDVVCANCHRRRTARRLESLRYRLEKTDDLGSGGDA